MSATGTRPAFTLVELMVVVAIVGTLLAVGMPRARELIAGHQIRSAASDLFAAINLTRSQALARGQRVMLTPAPPANTDWRTGWVVFVDRNGNARLDAGDELIFEQGPVASGISIRSAFSSGQATPYLAYNVGDQAKTRMCRGFHNTMALRGRHEGEILHYFVCIASDKFNGRNHAAVTAAVPTDFW